MTVYACVLTTGNKIISKNKYPLPRAGDLLDQLHAALMFCSVGLHSSHY